MSESALHKACADFAAVTVREPAFWTTIAHGGGGKIRGAQLKARGMKPGVADMLFIRPDATLWAELKTATGRQSPEQKAFEASVKACGHHYEICRSVTDLERTLRLHGFLGRAT